MLLSQEHCFVKAQSSSLDHDMTMLMITHRISSASKADMIIVLQDGCISQIGTHEELLHQEGLYQRIYHIQQEGGIQDGRTGI